MFQIEVLSELLVLMVPEQPVEERKAHLNVKLAIEKVHLILRYRPLRLVCEHCEILKHLFDFRKHAFLVTSKSVSEEDCVPALDLLVVRSSSSVVKRLFGHDGCSHSRMYSGGVEWRSDPLRCGDCSEQ